MATLVRGFEWKTVEGDEVDLSEKQEFAILMKNPLKVHLSPDENKVKIEAMRRPPSPNSVTSLFCFIQLL